VGPTVSLDRFIILPGDGRFRLKVRNSAPKRSGVRRVKRSKILNNTTIYFLVATGEPACCTAALKRDLCGVIAGPRTGYLTPLQERAKLRALRVKRSRRLRSATQGSCNTNI